MIASINKLTVDFYQRENVLDISRELLGKMLVTCMPDPNTKADIVTSGIITETEAYCAPEDKASHAYNNRRTKRTETMFAAGGVSYVYLCYGIHSLFNVVTGPQNMPHAILIRAIKPILGIEHMLTRRKQSLIKPTLSAGPGVLCAALGINTVHDNIDLTGNHIWIEDHRLNIAADDIVTTQRIGISYAKEYAAMPWRFLLKR